MERFLLISALLVPLAFAGGSHVYALEKPDQDFRIIEASTQTAGLTLPIGIDPIITGPTGAGSIEPRGILPLLDGCDADCQAKRLGLNFDK
ncbi:MAG: hypothetical protein U5K75_03615 [Ahrensia sp.]|nr:hypothetical protein [Ahrensia sp.]